MATIQRGGVTRGDLALWDGKTKTATRVDATGGTVTGLTIGEEIDVLQVFGDGTERTRATIARAVAQIGSAGVTLLFATGTWTVDSSLTIPSNFTCKLPAGCVFSVDAGQVLTFSGPVLSDSSSFYSGSGSTVLGVDSLVGGKAWIAATPAEIAANVTPTSYAYDLTNYGDMRRYGLPMDGASTCTAALNSAIAISAQAGPDIVFTFPRGVFVFATQPSNITKTIKLKGAGSNASVLVRDYTSASADVGLLNFRSTSIGSIVQDLMIYTGSARTGGSLISLVAPSSGDGPDYILLDNLRLTNSFGGGGTGNGPDYPLYVDGQPRSSPLGVRGMKVRECLLFGGALGSAYYRTVVAFQSMGTAYFSAGSVSGQVVVTGGSGTESQEVAFTGGPIYGMSLDYLNNLSVVVSQINGSVTKTVNVTNDRFFVDGVEAVYTRSGGNQLSVRYNASNPRTGLYTAGSAGTSFVGGNLTHDTGNTFNYDKNGLAWFLGDPTGAGNLTLAASTGSAGGSAGVHDLSARGITFVPGVGPHVPSYTVAGLPSAARAGGTIYVSNEAGGAVLAFSDGTNWRRVTDRAIVS